MHRLACLGLLSFACGAAGCLAGDAALGGDTGEEGSASSAAAALEERPGRALKICGNAFDDDDPSEAGEPSRVTMATSPSAVGRVIFVAAGWSDGESAFRSDAELLMETLTTNPDGIVGRAPELWSFEAVFPGDVGDSTLLGASSCRNSSFDDSVHVDRDASFSMAAATARDVVINLIGGFGRANAVHGFPEDDGFSFGSPPTVNLPLGDRALVLEHELGHALVFLGDEYGQQPEGCRAGLGGFSSFPDYEEPNLSVDPQGARFAPHVSGAVAGGRGSGNTCTFHPTTSCRMNSRHDRFCPVCSAAIDDFIAARRALDHAPPRCWVDGFFDPATVDDGLIGSLHVSSFVTPLSARVELDGRVLIDAPHIGADHLDSNSAHYFVRQADVPETGELVVTCTDALGSTARTAVPISRAR